MCRVHTHVSIYNTRQAGGAYKGDESIGGTREREGKRDSTAAAEISGSAGQPIELLSWSGGTLWRCEFLFVIPCKGSLYFCGAV